MEDKVFTGGDTLTGMEKRLHDILMKTELNNGKGAYKLTYAESQKGGTSGLSFGGNQMDLSTAKNDLDKKVTALNPKKIFSDIVENATVDGNTILIESEKLSVEAKDITQKGKTPEEVFGALLPKVNQALSSEYGVAKINEAYAYAIKDNVEHVRKAVEKVSNRKNRDIILNNEELFLRLCDYHNQFNLVPNGKMIDFLSGKKVILESEYPKYDNVSRRSFSQTAALQLLGEPKPEDIEAFIRATKQYHKSEDAARGVEGRFKKLAEHFKTAYTPRKPYTYEIGGTTTELEAGNPNPCSLSGQATVHSCNLNFDVNPSRIRELNLQIRYDDHAWLTLNGKVIFESIEGVSEHRIETEKGKRFVVTSCARVPAETSRVTGTNINLTNLATPGHNSLVLYVIVEDGGTAYMKLSCKNR